MSPALIEPTLIHIHDGESGSQEITAKHTTTAPDVSIVTNGDSVSNLESLLAKLSKFGNPSLFVTPEHTLELRETSIPRPSPQELLIHVRCTGICGSDLHLWHHGAIGPLTVDCPSILGHEAAGVVLAMGSEVTNFAVGDRVAIEPGVPCRKCFLCEQGKYNLCEAVAFAGVCPYAGTIRRFMTHDARYCHKIPDNMTYAQAALLEPLSVILHAVSRCEGSIQIGRPALICGAGPIGLIALAAAKASGAWPLVITDIDESRLRFAQTFLPGVKTYHVDLKHSASETAEGIRRLYGCTKQDSGPNSSYDNEYSAPGTVIECTGTEASVITAAYSCRRGGTVMVVGVGRSIMNNLPFMHLSLAEIDLKFINRYRDTWAAGINALVDGQVMNLDSLVTHSFPLEQATSALELSADRSQQTVKIHIVDELDINV